MNCVIEFSGVSKAYKPGLLKKKVQAVRELNLGIVEGEIFGLIGPNGAGKSTTIRMLLGTLRPDAGQVLLRGQVPAETELQREVGYLPENPFLYDYLTLDEILSFCGRVSGMEPDLIMARSDSLLERLGLQDARRRALRTYSKGMLQRAAIAFALLHDPSLVVFDEPMSGLDPIGRKMVFELVSELKTQGKTIFFCSHILSDVERLCDRIGMMVGGRLVEVFNQEQFWNEGNQVFLSLDRLESSQHDKLKYLGYHLVDEREGHVLAVAPGKLVDALNVLGEMEIVPNGSRAEGVSLEELFMRVVEGVEE